jgi:hypothetical protein
MPARVSIGVYLIYERTTPCLAGVSKRYESRKFCTKGADHLCCAGDNPQQVRQGTYHKTRIAHQGGKWLNHRD